MNNQSENSPNNESVHFFVNPVFNSSDNEQSNEIINNNQPSDQVNHNIDYDKTSNASFTSLTIDWNNLNVHSKASSKLINLIGNSKEPVHIIKNVSGHVEPGNLLAILGPSGAGKTTLLNVLTGQNLRNVTIKGQVLLNNEPTTLDDLSSYSSYVQQDDLFFGYLTVKEHLRFQLELRSPVLLTNSQIDDKIDQLLERLGLLKVANSRIDCEKTGQRLSGGERKRLSIATEILTDPSILFCDEPTSGLDSFMAASAISVLKSLASEGRTIICTIHQPSSDIFKMFDKIMLMANGRVAFFGTNDQAFDFFASNNLNCPSNYNPADFFIQQLSIVIGDEQQCLNKVNMICDNYENSEYFKTIKKQISSTNGLISNGTDKSSNLVKPSNIRTYRRDAWTQFRLLFWRSMLTNVRDPMLNVSRIFNALFSVALVSLVYLRQDYNQEGIMNINGAIFLLIVSSNFSSIFVVINAFCMETPIFLREQALSLYRVSVYFLARTLAEQPYFIFLPIMTWSISYYAIGLYNDINVFFIGNGVAILIVNAASGFGYFVSTISNGVTMGLELATPLQTPLMLLSGSFLNNASIPGWINWIKYLSWVYYSNEILTVNQWRYVTKIDCDYDIPMANQFLANLTLKSNGTIPAGQGCLVNGPQVIDSLGFSVNNLQFNYWMLIVVIIIFRSLAYIILVLRAKLRR